MNKEPLGLYIFRFIVGFGLFTFMALLYWSSNLLEQNVNHLKEESAEIKNEIVELRLDIEHLQEDLAHGINLNKVEDNQRREKDSNNNLSKRPHIDPELPNLLQEDPFYEKTLPAMLGQNFKPSGIRRGAVVGKPDNLHPFSNWSNVSSWVNQCTVALSTLKFGIYETFAPDMAIKIELRKGKNSSIPNEFWIHLREGVNWAPINANHFSQNIRLAPVFLKEHPVTAEDFKFYFDAIMNPHVQLAGAVAMRTYLSDIEDVEVIDKLTFVVRWKTATLTGSDGQKIERIRYVAKMITGGLRPLPVFVYQYFPDGKKIIEDDNTLNAYRTNSVWAQNFSQHWARDIIVSCGPWLFDGMSDQQILFKRNPRYYNPYMVLVTAEEVQFKNTPDAIWQDFKAGKIDNYNLLPNQLIELEAFLKSSDYQDQQTAGMQKNQLKEAFNKMIINRLDYIARVYSYIGWNQARHFFNNKRIRQAMTMAIDRQRIIDQILNGLGIEITGTFYRNSPNYDPLIQPWPYDPDESRRILAEEGWYDSDGSGIISKTIDGKRIPFRFSLTYYIKNPTTKEICEYISTALKGLGIDCNLNGVDIADLSAAFDDKSFDAIALAWALGTPPEEPRQLWSSEGAKEKGSSNAIGFSNPEIDKIIAALDYEDNQEKRIALYHRFNAILHEEAPYTFLYTPKTVLLYRNYLQNVFIPADRQELIPGANIGEPDPFVFWIKN